MFAFFGLGVPELLILGIVGTMLLLGLAVILIVAKSSSQKPNAAAPVNEIAELRAEVRRLREEIERLKKGPEKKEPSEGITADGAK